MTSAIDLGVEDVTQVVFDIFQIQGDVRRDEIRILCPVHQDVHPSCDVNIDTGLWSCFSCGAKGDLVGLGVIVLLEVPFKSRPTVQEKKRIQEARNEIRRMLKPGTPDAKLASIKRKTENTRRRPARSHRLRQDLSLPSPGQYGSLGISKLDYMRRRGFTKATIRAWDARWVSSQTLTKEDGNTFTLTDSIGIPVRNVKGEIQAWCYRKTESSAEWQPRYLYTPGFDLSGNWFGIHMTEEGQPIYIVEGPMDAMWLWQHGLPAIALMGSNHTNPRKFALLNRFSKAILFPDYDSGGVFMAHRVGLRLRGKIPVEVCRWPKAVVYRTEKESPDPQDIRRARDLKLVASRSIPWHTWCLRQGLPTREERTRR